MRNLSGPSPSIQLVPQGYAASRGRFRMNDQQGHPDALDRDLHTRGGGSQAPGVRRPRALAVTWTKMRSNRSGSVPQRCCPAAISSSRSASTQQESQCRITRCPRPSWHQLHIVTGIVTRQKNTRLSRNCQCGGRVFKRLLVPPVSSLFEILTGRPELRLSSLST